jgi:hypothetical protein
MALVLNRYTLFNSAFKESTRQWQYSRLSSQNKEVPMIPSLGTNTNGNNMDANNARYNQK